MKKFRNTLVKLLSFLKRRPLTGFFAVLSVIFGIILISSQLSKPHSSALSSASSPKTVAIYRLSTGPKVTFSGQVEKSGVLKILSQTAGIVQSIAVSEGQSVNRGALLVSLAANYQGGNPSAIQAAIAQRQNQMVLDTYNTQKDLISKQRSLANDVHDNAENLATISAQSRDDTVNLMNLNQTMLTSMQANLSALEANNFNNVNGPTILQIQGSMAQVLAGQNQLNVALRNLDYSTNTNNLPLQIADLQRDTTLQQLDLQQKTLDLNRDISGLQTTLANISATFFRPVAPFAGRIDRVYVRSLQTVTPGTPLVSLVGGKESNRLVVHLPKNIAARLDRLADSVIYLGNGSINSLPLYVSSDATDGTLYSAVYSLPDASSTALADGQYLQIDLPLTSPAGLVEVPLEAVFQAQDSAYVYLAKDGRAKSVKVTLGPVSGDFVEVLSGLSPTDTVILDRTTVDGDKVVGQ